MTFYNRIALSAAVLGFVGVAHAADYTLRIQTHYSAESTSGKSVAQFVDDIQTMSGGRIEVEMFYSSAVVKSVETFDAAANGIIDIDMTGAAYQTGKNPAFQFVGDVMGGYDTPWQMFSWLYHGGGKALADELYGEYGMKFISWWTPGQETMSSSKPLAGPADLKDWKFRSPPGMETEIFASMGASPIVMDFGEVFTALETKIIDGADASNLANNKSMGIYDIVKHATYPGFHSMPADHIAINKEKWDELPPDLQRIIEVAGERMGFRNSLSADVTNHLAAQELQAAGVTLYDWSAEDRGAFRKVAQAKWQELADRTPEARKIVDSHIEFMKMLGLIKD